MIVKKNNNQKLILSNVKSFFNDADKKILDYGCGEGALLADLIEAGYDAYGCDVADRAQNHRIKLMDNSFKIPYPDNFFDCVVSNQVIEHVHDIEIMMSEFNRVMKPQSKGLLLFPTVETFMEWHLFLPFIHWFNRFPRFQKLILYIYALLGLGHPKPSKSSKKQWVNDRSFFLQNHTRYRFRFSLIHRFKINKFDVKTIEKEFNYEKYQISAFLKLFINKITLPILLGSVFVITKR